MLWILVVFWTRVRFKMVQASADRWQEEYAEQAKVGHFLADARPGHSAKSLMQQAEKYHEISAVLAKRDRAYDKWQRRQHRADRLKRRLAITTKPRTLAGAFNGATAVAGIVVGAELLGVDLKEQIVLAKAAVSDYLAAL